MSILEPKFALFSMYSTSSRLMLPTDETDLSSSELLLLLISSISCVLSVDISFSRICILRLDPDDLEALDSAWFLPLDWSGGRRVVVFVCPASAGGLDGGGRGGGGGAGR